MLAIGRIRGLVITVFSPILLLVGLNGMARAQTDQANRPVVVSLSLSGVVDPFTADYIDDGISAAEQEGAAAVLITIDTPGGLDSSMRQIVKAILGSKIPVICYTGPAGARAASAGTFIMLACPKSAMSPGTNIGAAHPVGVSGAIEQEKVTNDAAAFIRSLAERWGRNADWAEDAVRNSVSVSAEEAQRLNVVDEVVPSPATLLRPYAGAVVEEKKLGIGASIIHGLIDPNLAFLFFFMGLILIVIELLHPGISVPGVIGTLMLVSSFVSFGFLPVELGGLVLLIASAVFFLLELKHPGLGLPTVGGVAFLVLGGLLLFNPSVPNARVSPWLIGTLAILVGLFFAVVVKAALAARHLPPATGKESLVGQEGVAVGDLDPVGEVRAGHESWTARAVGSHIAAGTSVRVVRVEGLRLVVEPAASPSPEAKSARRESAGAEGGVR